MLERLEKYRTSHAHARERSEQVLGQGVVLGGETLNTEDWLRALSLTSDPDAEASFEVRPHFSTPYGFDLRHTEI